MILGSVLVADSMRKTNVVCACTLYGVTCVHDESTMNRSQRLYFNDDRTLRGYQEKWAHPCSSMAEWNRRNPAFRKWTSTFSGMACVS